jgi:hypothetical protein
MNPIRARVSTWQARLGAKQDFLRKKLIDNTTLYSISDFEDCIRMRPRKSYEGDDQSWRCEKADVIHAVFPPMKDVPFRKIRHDKSTDQWQLTSLVSQLDEGEQKQHFSIQVPMEFDVDVNDLIFKVHFDPGQDYNIIIPLQVTELLGTFGSRRIIMEKVNCTIPTQEIPQKIVDTIVLMSKRRSTLGF